MTQLQTLAILKTGVNVFLTGEPGSGKTHTINEYAQYLRARRIEPAITASTGIAATHLGGTTKRAPRSLDRRGAYFLPTRQY